MTLFKNLEKYKKRVALVTEENSTFSYQDILDYEKYLTSKIKKKSLCFLLGSNNVECIILYVFLIRNNVPFVLINSDTNTNYILQTIKKFRPKYFFCPKEKKLNLKFKKVFYTFEHYDIFETDLKNVRFNSLNQLLLTTSGTTSDPKFVRLSKKNLKTNCDAIINYLSIKKSNKVLTMLPFSYSYGLSVINTHLESGAQIFLNNNSVFSKDFWINLKKSKSNSIYGVPQTYLFLKKLKFQKFLNKNIKYFLLAGGKLDTSEINFFYEILKKKKIKFFAMYGQTEASPRMSYFLINKNLKKINSIGKPLKGCKFQILDHKKRVLNKSGDIGELVFYGKNVSLGYAKNYKDLKKGDVNKGKLFTGDLGYFDNDRFYYIAGRKKRISKIFGNRINLDEIEYCLSKRQIDTSININDSFLDIMLEKRYSHKTDLIRDLIQKEYSINKNFIKINLCEKLKKNKKVIF